MTNRREYELQFSDVKLTNAAVQIYGPLRERTSMGNVAAQLFSDFAQAFDDVAVHNYFGGAMFNESIASAWALDLGAPVGVFVGIPDHVPEPFFDHPFAVGVFVCETDAIDPKWVEICNQLDLIVVPSQWCKRAFRGSGVKAPLLVVPHGLEADYQPYAPKRRGERFTFYNTFYKDSLCSRKSLEELVRCFTRVFRDRRDVVLRLRTEEGAELDECRRNYRFDGLIDVEPITQCSTRDFARIYGEVHCTVHPSKGEGFGFIPCQSIACETPVIAPHTTGMKDYLSDENSIALKTNGRVPGEITGNEFGTYFGIDEDHLCYCLEYALENWETEYDKVKRAAPDFRKRYSWQAVLGEFRDVVAGILDDGRRAETKRELTEVHC